jgi:hypothetical protein
MNYDIRKISVGKGYPDGAIHYQVGKNVKLQHVPYTVYEIKVNAYYRDIEGKVAYDIYLVNNEGKVLWKTIVDVPVIIEYNIDFE